MLQLTREQVVMWTGARLIREGTGPAAEPIPGVSSDSRSLKAGELFIALHGDRVQLFEVVGEKCPVAHCENPFRVRLPLAVLKPASIKPSPRS